MQIEMYCTSCVRSSALIEHTYVTPKSSHDQLDFHRWDVHLLCMARTITYVAILGLIAVIICLIIKYLGACDLNEWRRQEEEPQVRQVTEKHPLMPEKSFRLPYGIGVEDMESNTSSSSGELYNEKICVICYDMPWNCFFVPCGHYAACYECAKRIMDGEKVLCPICRRSIHKLRRLTIS